MEALKIAGKVAGAALSGVASSGGVIGSAAGAAKAGGNMIGKIATNITKWKAPNGPKKSRFKKINK